MRKLCVALGGMVLGGCFIIVDETGAVALGVPTPTLAVAAPRRVAIVGAPGVDYVLGQPNVLFYGSRWWRCWGGRWYYRNTWGGRWVVTSSVPLVFLRIPTTHSVHRSIVVHHPQYRKPALVKPLLKPGVVRPAPKVVRPLLKPGVVRPAPKVVRPARPPTRVGKPPLTKPGKPAKPGEKPEKKKKPKKKKPK